jgi:hypothetical protein
MSDEERIELLDRLIPDTIYANDQEEKFKLITDNKEKIEALLFNLKFPKEFWDEEKQKAHQFLNRLNTVPNLNEYIENWQTVNNETRKKVLRNVTDVFCQLCEIDDIKISFYTIEDYQEKQIAMGLDPKEKVPT